MIDASNIIKVHQRGLICLSCCSIAEALAKVKDHNMSASFRDLFLPNGQPPLSGLLTRRLDLAAILDAVADKGISEFYSGNLTQEMVAAVRKCFFGCLFRFFPVLLNLYKVVMSASTYISLCILSSVLTCSCCLVTQDTFLLFPMS